MKREYEIKGNFSLDSYSDKQADDLIKEINRFVSASGLNYEIRLENVIIEKIEQKKYGFTKKQIGDMEAPATSDMMQLLINIRRDFDDEPKINGAEGRLISMDEAPKCQRCEGSGRICVDMGDLEKDCPVCSVKALPSNPNPAPNPDCPRCEGKGILNFGEGDDVFLLCNPPCDYCGDKKEVPCFDEYGNDLGMTTCPKCN